MSLYTPTVGSTFDDDKVIALKILDGVNGVPSWTELDFTNNSVGNPTQIVYKNGSTTFLTLNLTYDGSGAFITQITTA